MSNVGEDMLQVLTNTERKIKENVKSAREHLQSMDPGFIKLFDLEIQNQDTREGLSQGATLGSKGSNLNAEADAIDNDFNLDEEFAPPEQHYPVANPNETMGLFNMTIGGP